MTSFRADPLLGLARGLLKIFMAITVVAAAAIIIAMPGVLIAHGHIMVEVARHVPGAARPAFLWAIEGILACALALAVAIWTFARKLRQIVDTVAAGDPFIPANAQRLRDMAWLAIGFQVIAIPLDGLAVWLASIAEPHHTHVEISSNGLLLALVLFILARVFRTGAAMREELEGTV